MAGSDRTCWNVNVSINVNNIAQSHEASLLRCVCWVVTTKQIRLQRLSKTVAAERRATETVRWRVPDCRTCNREGPTTESAEPVTESHSSNTAKELHDAFRKKASNLYTCSIKPIRVVYLIVKTESQWNAETIGVSSTTNRLLLHRMRSSSERNRVSAEVINNKRLRSRYCVVEADSRSRTSSLQ